MASKLLVLVVVTWDVVAFASNDSGSASDSRASELGSLEKLLWKLAPEAADSDDAALEAEVLKSIQAHDGDVTGDARKGKTIEDAVSNLVLSKAEAAFGATAFGGSVKNIIDLIDNQMFPKVTDAHKADQEEVNRLAEGISTCEATMKTMTKIADKSKATYKRFSPLHQTCRLGEAGLLTSKRECSKTKAAKKEELRLKKEAFDFLEADLGAQQENGAIVKKALGESVEGYLDRISSTICGGEDGRAECGAPSCGVRCKFQCAKAAWTSARNDYEAWDSKCKQIQKLYTAKVLECNNLQDQMDNAACKRAVDMKDACETYAECHTSKREAFDEAAKVVREAESDRHTEFRGLKRMKCLVSAFSDGKVDEDEIQTCKNANHSIDDITINYPTPGPLAACEVPHTYPTTSDYKLAEFAPLPALAKGKEDANECTGVMEISTTPSSGSPETCKCNRVTLNGPYGPGPMVKCTDCLDIRRSVDETSCPVGTKLFAPRSREDWHTFLGSAEPLRDPNWIVDITRPENGCGGCSKHAMNSDTREQSSWVTSDGSAWWLGDTPRADQPSREYYATCFLDLSREEDSVTFRTPEDCNYHSKSYYCQQESISETPKAGSPRGCRCRKVALVGRYSPGVLIKCIGCLDVSKTTQKNSCPSGTKIFAPRTPSDWRTFIDSATPLRSPNWIIDVTRPADGCPDCTDNAMNSDNLAQRTWRTTDGAAWWLRSTAYSEPSGDYKADCYLDLWHNPANEHSVGFNDRDCNNHADSYYCQAARKPPPPPVPAPPLPDTE